MLKHLTFHAFKYGVKSLFRSFGFDLRYLKHKDAFLDQKTLMSKINVKIIFDGGANIGDFAARYLKIFPNASIYCFEPGITVFQHLSERYKDTSRVQTINMALSDSSGLKKFYENQVSSTSSLLPINSKSVKYLDPNLMKSKATIDVDSVTINEFCRINDIDRINVLKMDIQGGELKALQSTRNLLENSLIDLVYIEVLFIPLYEGQTEFCQLCEFFANYGYVLYGLYDFNYTNNGVLAWADAIFISPQLEMSLG